ncbi:GNAT family N-acetyltransferase [Staphylococcus sp. ACRSN]|uniref:GNAT family N-acetyltransferase n=1 Tax=Staphylococcus sp. ACRSN TaxID=2918214 RepID=UPI001EF3537F|nr:GNAT family N-acetyltransferase [Staphylococcus sp. ACRSN]MCG7339120.1 GNAT family N-acetyltransferase [Staphylococcus sp. ACRSN]
MTIRLAENIEYKKINKIVPELFKEAITTNIQISDAELRQLSVNLVEKGAKYLVWMDTKNNLIKGFLLFEIKFDYLSQTNYGFIYELFILEPFRRQGGASKLMNHIQQFLLEKGIETIKLNVFSNNEAFQFYKSLGFVEEQITMSLRIK